MLDSSDERFLAILPNSGFKSGLLYKMRRYDVLLTDRRIIVVKAGAIIPWLPVMGVFAAAIPPAPFSSRADRFEEKTFDQILASDNGNFQIRHDRVMRAVFKAGNPGLLELPSLTVWTPEGRVVFQFVREEFRKAVETLPLALGAKLELEHGR